ncbi:MAG TPA: sugar phosphate nucleotidyltransferase [Candidatus Dojkabacteria bacterium]|nr:sugar phosphate nucleotidyltransferase [Candidatus Dojkabacteria bacterium]
MHNNVTVIILAGGIGSRLGTIGQIVPKPLMPIYDSILIEGNLLYATTHFENVIVSTRPELLGMFKSYLKTIQTKNEWANRVKLISNSSHQKSSLDALSFLKSVINTEYFLLMFSDIYFLSDPFVNMPNKVENNILGLTKIVKKSNKKLGLAKTQNEKVISLKYDFLDEDLNNSEWNGISIMKSNYLQLLDTFLIEQSTPIPEEDFINNLIFNDIIFKYILTPQFINANTNEDLFTISQIRRNTLLNLNQ